MKPGSIVRCIDDSNWRELAHQDFPRLPVKDALYTIRRIIPNIIQRDGPTGVALEEIRGVWDTFQTYEGTYVYEECHFRLNRFEEVLPPQSIESLLEEIMVEPLFINQ